MPDPRAPGEATVVELTLRYVEGDLDDEQFSGLEAALRGSADHRSTFVRTLQMDAALTEAAGADSAPAVPAAGECGAVADTADIRPSRARRPRARGRRRAPRTRSLRWVGPALVAAAAAVLVAALLPRGLPWTRPERETGVAEVELPSTAVPDRALRAADTAGKEARRSIARVAAAEGGLDRCPAGSDGWSAADPGTGLFPGDSLCTADATARIATPSGSLVHLNRFTMVELGGGEPLVISLARGEVYVETADADRGLAVDTPHGRALDIGTRFCVELRPGGTSVLVAEGRVTATTAAGRVEVEAGHETVLRGRSRRPDPPRRAVDLERRIAWATGVAPAVSHEILLLPADARIVGSFWRGVKDRAASSGVALEAPPMPKDWSWPGGRQRSRSGYVEYAFEAQAGKRYHLWIRGKCTARTNRIASDAVTVVTDGRFSPACVYLVQRGVNGWVYNGFYNRAGYWWIGGDADNGHDRIPVSITFEREGTHSLRMYAFESPVRIDAIWLSTSQKVRPADAQRGPERP